MISRRTLSTLGEFITWLSSFPLRPMASGWPSRPIQRGHYRLSQYSLRASDRADGPQLALPDPVVDGPARDAEQFGGMLE